MLRRLRIENLSVVEDATLEFGEGLNVLTGSTGAGKSLIVGAVNLLLGERAPADLIRQGAEEARVEADFDTDPAGRQRTAADSGTVTLARRVSRAGRTMAWIDGSPVAIRELRLAAVRLIEPHGQNIQYHLRDPQQHVEYLDAFANNGSERVRYQASLAELRRALAEVERYDIEAAALAEKRELYAHRLSELERVAPEPGEKHTLETRARLFANAERLYSALEATCSALYDDDASAATLVGESERRVQSLTSLDPRIASLAERLAQAAVLISEATSDARGVLDTLDFDPADVERTQERLAVLARMEQRFGASVDTLIEQARSWREILDGADAGTGRRTQLVRVVAEAAQRVAGDGVALTTTRTKSARELDRRVSEGVRQLSMRGAVFRTDIRHEEGAHSPVRIASGGVAFYDNGLDVVRMRVRTNPGEAEGGLEEIASTGELSRVALVLKQLAAAGTPDTTLIFDEIDAGIGADLGDALAENLLALSKQHQIICITHMPQIAARGQSHLIVQKEIDGERTRVRVRAADGDERTREIARMLGGNAGQSHLALAAELLLQKPPCRSQ